MTGSELKKWREARNMTQEQLAKALGISVNTMSRWEQGSRGIPAYLEMALKWYDHTSEQKTK